MLCEERARPSNQALHQTVLILVLMEDALRVEREDGTHLFLLVLILVLMEDALRVEYLCSDVYASTGS